MQFQRSLTQFTFLVKKCIPLYRFFSNHQPYSSPKLLSAVSLSACHRQIQANIWSVHYEYVQLLEQLINCLCLCWAPEASKEFQRVWWLIKIGRSWMLTMCFLLLLIGTHIHYLARHCETWEYPSFINPPPRQQQEETNVWKTCVSQISDWRPTWLTAFSMITA